MKVKIKRLNENAVIPKYSKPGDAGMDLTATSVEVKHGCLVYGTGIAVEIPEGHVGLVFPRSSVYKTGLDLTNCVGVVDSGYRGEVKAVFRAMEMSANCEIYKTGDRIAQLIIMPYPKVEFEEVEELSKTERGEGGYGSTGR